jgi:membrane-bound serine protease (ClpP class)
VDVNSLNQFVMDPNVIYLILIFGLWVAVTAAYIPGTGAIEVLAFVTLAVSIIVLSSLPTNWGAVLLLALGVVSFLLVPFFSERFAILAQAGLILQAIGGAWLFNGLSVSWLIIAVSIGIALLYHNFVLLPLLRSNRQAKIVFDDSLLVGMVGQVTSGFMASGSRYIGTVNVRSEQWTAYSSKPLSVGDEITVIERDGLQLLVEGLKHKQAPKEEAVS